MRQRPFHGWGLVRLPSPPLFSEHSTTYPGAIVGIPVIGTGLVIAGGTANPKCGAEYLLKRTPFQWLGRRSYSLYLWHWPLLIVFAERGGVQQLPVWENLLLLVVALIFTILTFRLIENPVRHIRVKAGKTVVAGVLSVVMTVALLTALISDQSSIQAKTSRRCARRFSVAARTASGGLKRYN